MPLHSCYSWLRSTWRQQETQLLGAPGLRACCTSTGVQQGRAPARWRHYLQRLNARSVLLLLPRLLLIMIIMVMVMVLLLLVVALAVAVAIIRVVEMAVSL